jgi:S-methylmethionine-dependent homocysteine/selenocysteine methylase
VIIDGGTGSELKRRGIEHDPVYWSAVTSCDHKAVLRAVHGDYIRAGAEVITANTFATARYVLAAAGLSACFAAINRLAVEAACETRDALDRHVAIAGSISCLPPRLDARAYPTPDVERDTYRELADFLAEAGVDLLALEMMQDPHHGAMAAAAAAATGLPFWLGVSARLIEGRLVGFDCAETALEDTLDRLLEFGPSVVNVMHTPMDAIGPALALVRELWSGPTGAYPELEDAPARITPEALVAAAETWVRDGARLLGGCCGAGPEHIQALSDARARLAGARGYNRNLLDSAQETNS